MKYRRFKILKAVGEAYRFTGREWRYLLKIGMVPMVLHVLTALFVQFYRPDASLMESYLWGLPVAFLFGIFTFAQTRLLLLGERLDRLPPADVYKEGRPRMMQASVFLSVLFHMFVAGNTVALVSLIPESGPLPLPSTLAAALIIGMMFWGVRLGLLPVLAAVGYPLRRFLQNTATPMLSLQLLTMGMVAMFPVAAFFQVALSVLITPPDAAALAAGIPVQHHVLLLTLSAPFSLLTHVLLNSAAAYALKQMLGDKK